MYRHLNETNLSVLKKPSLLITDSYNFKILQEKKKTRESLLLGSTFKFQYKYDNGIDFNT